MNINFHIGTIDSKIKNAAVNQILARDFSDNIIVITPEQVSMDMQLKLVKGHKNSCIGNISVLSFARLAYVINNEKYRDNRTLLSDVSADIIVSKLISKDKYTRLRARIPNRRALVSSIREFFAELGRYAADSIDYRDKLTALDDYNLKEKIDLLIDLYDEYKSFVSDDYSLGETALEALIKKSHKSDILSGSLIYVDGFAGFTPLQLKVLESFFSVASELNFFFVADALSLENTDENTNLYYETMSSYQRINDILKFYPDIHVDKIIYSDENALNIEKSYLSKFLFSEKNYSYTEPSTSIYLSDFASRKNEVDTAVAKINSLIRQGYRYKDLTVYLSDIKTYEKILISALKKAEISYYFESKENFSANDAIAFVLDILSLYDKNFEISDVLKYFKSYFIELETLESHYLENYLLAYGKRGLSFYESDWIYAIPHLEKTEELNLKYLSKINEIRHRFFTMLSSVHFKKKDSVENYIVELMKLLDSHDFSGMLEKRVEYFEERNEARKADIYSQIYTKLMELLAQMRAVSENEIIKFEDFVYLLNEGKKNLEISHIPSYVDEILIADLSKSKAPERKVSFVLGLNDGLDLKVDSSSGFLNDYEREKLSNIGINLAPIQKKRNVLERFYVYKSVLNFSDKLFLSYANTDDDGNKLHKSYTLSEIEAIFPMITSYKEGVKLSDFISTKSLVFDYLNEYEYLSSILSEDEKVEFDELKKASKHSGESNLSDANISLIFPKDVLVSVSRLEKYAACPKSFFIRYILGAKERKLSEINMPEVGNVSHYIFENIVNDIMNSDLDYTDLDGIKINAMIDSIAEGMLKSDEFKAFTYNYASMGHFNRIKRKVNHSLNIMRAQISRGSFRPLSAEFEFSYSQKIPENLSHNRNLKILGKIDRVDEFEINNKKYISIVDYKTRDKILDFNKVYAGLSLQMLIYLSISSNLLKANPAGMQYFSIDRKYSEKKSYTLLSEDELLSENKMISYILDNEDVIKGYDRDFADTSLILNHRKVKKTGTYSQTMSSMLISKENLDTILKFSDKNAFSITGKMLSGNISNTPYRCESETACDLCNYQNICKFNKNLDEKDFLSIEKNNTSGIIDMMASFLNAQTNSESEDK